MPWELSPLTFFSFKFDQQCIIASVLGTIIPWLFTSLTGQSDVYYGVCHCTLA